MSRRTHKKKPINFRVMTLAFDKPHWWSDRGWTPHKRESNGFTTLAGAQAEIRIILIRDRLQDPQDQVNPVIEAQIKEVK